MSLDEIDLDGELSLSDCLADNEPNPEQVYIATKIRELINKNLDELSPRLRTAFLLREISGYSTSEAAKELGVAENALKARLWRARRQLAMLLQAQRTLVEICWARQQTR